MKRTVVLVSMAFLACELRADWQQVNPPITATYHFAESVLADPVRPGEFYAFLQEQVNAGNCVLVKSTDFGRTWTQVSVTPLNGDAWGAAIDPNPNRNPATPPTIYTPMGYGDMGLYKSTDGGVTWTQLFPGSSVFDPYSPFGLRPDVYSITVLPDNPPQHLLITFHGGWKDPSTGNDIDAGFGESADGGATWTVHRIPGAGRSQYIMAVNANTWVSISQIDDAPGGGLWKTDTGGRMGGVPSAAAWRRVDDHWHLHGSFQSALCGGALYAPGYHGIKRSLDGGDTWTWVHSTGGYDSSVVAAGNYLYSNYDFGPSLLRASATDDTDWTSYTTTPAAMTNGSSPYGAVAAFDGSLWHIVMGNGDAGLWHYTEAPAGDGVPPAPPKGLRIR